MNTNQREVSTVAGLLDAAANPAIRQITVTADIADMPGFRLSPGQTLTATRAEGRRLQLHLAAHGDASFPQAEGGACAARDLC
ncbi:hypothetical protein QCE62_25085 [Caballeronia sp. LZ033]|uniref:hypothetical protein n=1 Tax=Caballeronia sp. LZ033 TaxID=3038566 RepID=UPI0028652E47|nr:hypothetical protein [Caballeronia sp. LZ033]MDR5816877.1 hypothetical protein [Caballeronia sp. LZ033]